MRFIVDMPLGVRVAAWLRDNGHDAVHLRELQKQKLEDPDIFALAVAEQRIIVTADLGFAAIAARARETPTSVILFRLPSEKATEIIARLPGILSSAAIPLMNGAIVTVEPHRSRIRRLPIE